MGEKTIQELDFATLIQRNYTPSPAAWEDQVLYFLMLDRFSDGSEKGYVGNNNTTVNAGTTPMFSSADANNASRNSWLSAGRTWCGGNLKGLKSKLGYLKRLGVTAIWISPIFKQVAFQPTYHGYGIQNFLEVDAHFGSREDLRELVKEAHQHGIYVILDIILNHAGNVFAYEPDRYWVQRNGSGYFEPRWDDRMYQVKGFNAADGTASLPFGDGAAGNGSAWPDGAIWPQEFQRPDVFTRKGQITNWNYEHEFREGDFFDLKNIQLGEGSTDYYQPSRALQLLCQVYKFWIGYTDIDGFRVDTVKHMDDGATRYFGNVIKEFASSIGKENFYLIAEITGGRQRAFTTLEITGLDAALGIDDIPDKLEYLVKGYRNPEDYFNLFRNSLLIGKESHTWFRNKVVNMFDDHDQVRKGNGKARFCGRDEGHKTILAALALNIMTLGIPCIYYGSEQAFNGASDEDRDGNDVFLRECMFGGQFGSFQSAGRHFFNESTSLFKELAKIITLRRQHISLRRGRQYLRQISGNGFDFGYPRIIGNEIRSIVPWSRIFNDEEFVVAINTDTANAQSSWVTIDAALNNPGDKMKCIYSTDASQVGMVVTVEPRNGSAVNISIPPAGFVIYEAV